MPESDQSALRVLSVVEATTVTGPIKPLLMFSKRARARGQGQRSISHSLVTTVRSRSRTAPSGLQLAAIESGLPVHLIPERFPFDLSILQKLAKHIADVKPQLIETHDFKSHFLVYLLRQQLRRENIRWIAYHHGYTRMSWRVRAYQQLDRWSLPKADRVLTLCKPFVVQLQDRGISSDRITVITNAVEERPPPTRSELEQVRSQHRLPEGVPLILSVGRLSPEKGHDELIAAFRQIIADKAFSDTVLVIVGDGGERQRLRQTTADLGDRVRFLGHQPDPWAYYHLATVFALPSHSEGSPLVLFEAMAARCPIVATAVGGIPEVVENNSSAMLIEPSNASALAASLKKLLADGPLRRAIGETAGDGVARFSPANYTDRMFEIYDLVLGGA